MWTDVFGIFQKYMGTGLMVIWLLAAIIYLFLAEKRKPRRILFVYFPVLILLLYFNPLFAKVFCSLVDSEIYFRICWLLPVAVVLGYSAVRLAEALKGLKKAVFTVSVLLLVVLSGKLVYSNPLYSRAENAYHVPDSVVHICDAIHYEGREVMAAFPGELLLYVRQYDPYICMPYGREVFMGKLEDFYGQMEKEVLDMETLARYSKELGVHYLIISEKKEIPEDPRDFDFEVFDQIDGYVIYRNRSISLEY